MIFVVEVTIIRTYSRNTNKLRNDIHHRKRSDEHLHQEMEN